MSRLSGGGWIAAGARLLTGHNSGGAQTLVAFTARGGRICRAGFNSYTKTHPRQNHYARLAGQPLRSYLHAEVAALLRSPADVDTLYICRFDKKGNPVSAAPCPVCRLAIAAFNRNLRVIHT
jgi:hypothetical protein